MEWVELKETYRDVTSATFLLYKAHTATSYLTTRPDVVKEILKRSQVVAEECGQKYALNTYDLAIAKIAKRIIVKKH